MPRRKKNSKAMAENTAATLHELIKVQTDLIAAIRDTPIQVQIPLSTPKLGTFTGLKPRGGGELSFAEWKERVEVYLNETNDSEEKQLVRVKNSLKGVACEQTKDCTKAADIVVKLQSVYGDVRCAEDVYLDMINMKLSQSEMPSQFLLRVWTKLAESKKFEVDDIKKKVYHHLLSQLKTGGHPLVEFAIRTKYGPPGAAPDLEKVLETLKTEENQAPQQPARHPRQQVQQAGIDYELLADMVAKKLQPTPPLHSEQHQPPLPPNFHPGPSPKRGPCYHCGLYGHMARLCRNPPNPQLVKQERLNYQQLLLGSGRQLRPRSSSWQQTLSKREDLS